MLHIESLQHDLELHYGFQNRLFLLENSTVSLKSKDPACNPYLSLSISRDPPSIPLSIVEIVKSLHLDVRHEELQAKLR